MSFAHRDYSALQILPKTLSNDVSLVRGAPAPDFGLSLEQVLSLGSIDRSRYPHVCTEENSVNFSLLQIEFLPLLFRLHPGDIAHHKAMPGDQQTMNFYLKFNMDLK